MYVKIITSDGTQIFPCTRVYDQPSAVVVERAGKPFMTISREDNPKLSVYVLNNEGKTIDAFHR